MQLSTAELQERVPREAPAEQQNARGVLNGEKDQRLPQFTLRGGGVARALGQDSQVQVGHGKTGVEINGGQVVLDGAVRIAVMFAAQGHEVMRACVEFIKSEQPAANFFGLVEPAVVREQDGAQEQRVGVLVRICR